MLKVSKNFNTGQFFISRLLPRGDLNKMGLGWTAELTDMKIPLKINDLSFD